MGLYFLTYSLYLLSLISATTVSSSDAGLYNEISGLKFQDINDMKFIREHVFLASSNETLDETKFNEVARAYAKKKDIRFVNTPVVKSDLSIPVSNCLISLEGSGGSIGYSGSFSISSSLSLDGDISAMMLSTDPSIEIDKSVSFSLSYSCTAVAGGVAQIQLNPIYVSFDYQTKGQYFKSLTNEIVGLSESWSEVKMGAFPVVQTPVFRCVNASAAICGAPPINYRLPSS